MRVVHLSLLDYRNYGHADVSLVPGRNLVLGRNGQGKTNLVEAIAYFASLRSHRVTSDSALIRAGAAAAVVRMRVGVLDREASLEIQINRGQSNRAQVNGNVVRPRELTRWFSAVVFAPEDLMIVRGEPALRRRFLDEGVVARNPAMSQVLSDYERVVRQRTSLLKSARASGARANLDASLEVWDEQLISLGSRIVAERRRLVNDLRAPLAEGYGAIAAADHSPALALAEALDVDVSRETLERDGGDRGDPTPDVSRETIAETFRAALRSARRAELERGLTLVGPHRDDLALQLNGLPVKGYASHGESWSFALALRLSLAALLREESAAGDPVIVLDDVFAELDAERRRRLMDAVGDYEQVVVTAAVEEDIFSDATPESSWHTVRVAAGEIVGCGTEGGGADGEA